MRITYTGTLGRSVTAKNLAVYFTLRREMLLAGADELGLTLRRIDEIIAWQRLDAARRHWAVPNVSEEHAP